VSPTLKTSLSIATSTQRPRSSLMRKAILVIRDIVRQQLRSAEVVT
jgi:predicted transcriptional regulator